MYARREDSGQTVHLHSLARALASRPCDKFYNSYFPILIQFALPSTKCILLVNSAFPFNCLPLANDSHEILRLN